jgi:CheY-like chemotaxis protein
MKPLSILHVDDDPMNLRVVQEILTAFGHDAVMAHSGAEALQRLDSQAFDVVLMDIHMPEMGGLEVVSRLRRAAGPQRDTPVIALTADIVTRQPQEYAALGFTDFVSKPIMVSTLMAAVVRAACGAPPQAIRRMG